MRLDCDQAIRYVTNDHRTYLDARTIPACHRRGIPDVGPPAASQLYAILKLAYLRSTAYQRMIERSVTQNFHEFTIDRQWPGDRKTEKEPGSHTVEKLDVPY